MIKRLLLMLVLVCAAFSQGAISIPPYMLSESLRESRAHGAKLHDMQMQPNGDVVFRVGDYGDELRYELTYCRGSLISVKCIMFVEVKDKDYGARSAELEEFYAKFSDGAEKSFGEKGKVSGVEGGMGGIRRSWQNDVLSYSVTHNTRRPSIDLFIEAHPYLYR